MVRFSAVGIGDANVSDAEWLALIDSPIFGAVLDRMPDGVIILDDSSQVWAVNTMALDINGLRREGLMGMTLSEMVAASRLDWSAAGAEGSGKRRDFHTPSDDGRAILTSVRELRDGRGQKCLTLILQRDLQVLDHLRRTASDIGGGKVFRFLSERDIVPDFEAQKALSPVIESTLARSTRALHQGARLLLLGESGSGKTELARYLHRIVGTREEPFIHVNCGAIPESLFESEMFGYEKGAFTGALQSGKKGLIEAAEGGTLFLDEVGEIPLASQAKLLKFLEDGVVQQIGGRRGRRVSARIISATNRELWDLVMERRFRSDLYYRLAVITVELPPLRTQSALIGHLIDHFLDHANRMRRPALALGDDCRQALDGYDFPGNIRELHNIIQHLSVVADRQAVVAHLPDRVVGRRQAVQDVAGVPASPEQRTALSESAAALGEDAGALSLARPLKEQVRRFERTLIEQAIARCGSKRKAAKALGVDIGTIVRKTRPEPAGNSNKTNP